MNHHPILRAGLSLSLLLAAAACANVPLADLQQDAEAKRFQQPAQDSGALYVYRSGLMGFVRPIDVAIAGGASAQLASNTYLRLEDRRAPSILPAGSATNRASSRSPSNPAARVMSRYR